MSLFPKRNSLVSVIVPIFNRFIIADETISSVITQSYRPIEIIIMDDFSDSPYQPIRIEAKDIKIILVRNERNLGPGRSREIGRKMAKGDYICYLDSDDLWHPEKIKKQIEIMKNNPKAGMCYCASVEFNSLPITNYEIIRKRSIQSFKEFLPTILDGRPWDTGACMWSKQASEMIGPWFSGWSWEDYEYECRAGCLDIQIQHIPDILCYTRKTDSLSQLSNANDKNAALHQSESIMEMSKNIINYGKQNDKEISSKFVKNVLRINLINMVKYKELKAAFMTLDTMNNYSKKTSLRAFYFQVLRFAISNNWYPYSNFFNRKLVSLLTKKIEHII